MYVPSDLFASRNPYTIVYHIIVQNVSLEDLKHGNPIPLDIDARGVGFEGGKSQGSTPLYESLHDSFLRGANNENKNQICCTCDLSVIEPHFSVEILRGLLESASYLYNS